MELLGSSELGEEFNWAVAAKKEVLAAESSIAPTRNRRLQDLIGYDQLASGAAISGFSCDLLDNLATCDLVVTRVQMNLLMLSKKCSAGCEVKGAPQLSQLKVAESERAGQVLDGMSDPRVSPPVSPTASFEALEDPIDGEEQSIVQGEGNVGAMEMHSAVPSLIVVSWASVVNENSVEISAVLKIGGLIDDVEQLSVVGGDNVGSVVMVKPNATPFLMAGSGGNALLELLVVTAAVGGNEI